MRPRDRMDHLRRRLATVVTEALSPLVLSAGTLLAVGAVSGAGVRAGLGWGAVAGVFVGGLPYGFLLLGVRRGRWTDRHVRKRTARLVPLTAAAASIVVGIAVLTVAGAPRQVTALTVAGLVGCGVTIAVTRLWKMSVHTAVASGSVTVLAVVFGPWLHLLWPVVALVGWSRTELRDHTPAQVLVGALLGALVAGTVFPSLR